MPFNIGGITLDANNAYTCVNDSVVQQGLVLHLNAAVNFSYPGSGNTIFDTSPFSHHGTLTNGTSYTTTANGALSFDGTNDYVDGVHNDSVNITGDMTCEVWFTVAGTPGDWVRVFGKGNAGTRTYGLWYNPSYSGDKTFLYQRASDILYTFNYSLNTWYHFVGTSSGTNHIMYVNGSQVGTGSWGTSTGVAEAYTLGYGLMHTYHNGLISVARLYNRALSAGEVSINFNAERARYGV